VLELLEIFTLLNLMKQTTHLSRFFNPNLAGIEQYFDAGAELEVTS
jgi:hypothetical protein